MEIHSNDEILNIASPKHVEKNNKSSDEGFNAILRDTIDNYSKIHAQNQKPMINTVSPIHFSTFGPEEKKSMGKILAFEGKAVIQRKDVKGDYDIKKDLPLLEGDTIVTGEKGRIRLRLNDGSIVTVAPNSKLVINQSLYDSVKKTWVSSLNMMVGKAEFWVRKALHIKRPEFNVNTPYAICGARGSIFVVNTTHESTRVTTFEDTKIEVTSLAAPEVKPTILESFEWTLVKEGALSSEVGKLPPWEAERLKQEFLVSPEIASA